jgi:hypothetical protein
VAVRYLLDLISLLNGIDIHTTDTSYNIVLHLSDRYQIHNNSSLHQFLFSVKLVKIMCVIAPTRENIASNIYVKFATCYSLLSNSGYSSTII